MKTILVFSTLQPIQLEHDFFCSPACVRACVCDSASSMSHDDDDDDDKLCQLKPDFVVSRRASPASTFLRAHDDEEEEDERRSLQVGERMHETRRNDVDDHDDSTTKEGTHTESMREGKRGREPEKSRSHALLSRNHLRALLGARRSHKS